MNRDELRQELAELIAAATEGDVPAAVALAGGAPLTALGVTSLAALRLVDAVEERYGAALDPVDIATAESLDRLVDALAGHEVRVDGG